ncbi:MAG: Ppx/GppA phosphatase family protein [Bacteroidota bacterium]
MRVSAIDIGTNTLLLLIADVGPGGTITPVYNGHIIARLGRGVDRNGVILPETVKRVLAHLSDYRRLSDEHKADVLVACGTSALRDAANREEFIAGVQRQCGFTVRILSGDEEAELTYLGAVSDHLPENRNGQFCVLDIGGGSTEITEGTGETIGRRTSVDVGSVRLTERILTSSPPEPGQLAKAAEFIRSHLGSLSRCDPHATVIGVAGTVTTLAAMQLNLPRFQPERVHGTRLGRNSIGEAYEMLKTLTVDQIRSHRQIAAGREDILLAGILILMEAMDVLGVGSIRASDRGLRYGMALKAGG